MKRINELRPSYASVASTLALVAALAVGGAYAQDKLGSKQIANSAVKSKHVKNDAVRGLDVNESSLAQVPSAARADAARTAESAETALRAETARTADAAESALRAQTAKTAGAAETALRAEIAGRAENVFATEVGSGCTVTPGGGITAFADGTECRVSFPVNIGACAILLGTQLGFPGGGETTYRKVGEVVVEVSRRDPAGGTPTAGHFSIAAICPA